jgi:hypothetical protein
MIDYWFSFERPVHKAVLCDNKIEMQFSDLSTTTTIAFPTSIDAKHFMHLLIDYDSGHYFMVRDNKTLQEYGSVIDPGKWFISHDFTKVKSYEVIRATYEEV